MSTPTILLTVGTTVLVLAVLFIIILYWIYSYAFRRAKTDCTPYDGLDTEAMRPFAEQSRERIDALLAREYEDVYISTPLDGTRLHGRLFITDSDAPIQIMCHGYRSNPYRDFSGGAHEALRMGHSVLLIDERAHHASGGKTISFGIRERHDLVGWASYVASRFPTTDIILVGISMGGATVVAASELELPNTVRCIISDCPYASVRDVLVSTARKLHFPAAVYPLIRLAGRLFGGFDTEDGDFTACARHSRLPILILHGEADGLVPPEMSARLAAANPTMIKRITFRDAHHGTSYLTDSERYIREVYSFVGEHLGVKP